MSERPSDPHAATGHAAVIRQALPPRNSRQRLDTLTPETQQSRAAHFALDALLAERQQDKESIERLSEGLILAADALEPLGEWLVNDSPAMPGEVTQPLLTWIERAEEFMVALAIEEDARDA